MPLIMQHVHYVPRFDLSVQLNCLFLLDISPYPWRRAASVLPLPPGHY